MQNNRFDLYHVYILSLFKCIDLYSVCILNQMYIIGIHFKHLKYKLSIYPLNIFKYTPIGLYSKPINFKKDIILLTFKIINIFQNESKKQVLGLWLTFFFSEKM